MTPLTPGSTPSVYQAIIPYFCPYPHSVGMAGIDVVLCIYTHIHCFGFFLFFRDKRFTVSCLGAAKKTMYCILYITPKMINIHNYTQRYTILYLVTNVHFVFQAIFFVGDRQRPRHVQVSIFDYCSNDFGWWWDLCSTHNISQSWLFIQNVQMLWLLWVSKLMVPRE